MIKKDIPILRKLFILLDYGRKLLNENLEVKEDEKFIDAMYDKIGILKTKLSFKYKRRDEIALRYLASKSKLAGLS